MSTASKLAELRRRVLLPMATDDRLALLRVRATQIVPGTGNPESPLAIVGEAPGQDEDESGLPFVGPAGQLLNEFVDRAGLDREQLWITNLVKYRPVYGDNRNRAPFNSESRACRGYLARELGIVNPKVVVLCGKYAYQAVFPGASVTRDHGIAQWTHGDFRNVAEWHAQGAPGRVYVPVFHPSFCLRQEEYRGIAASDWTRIRDYLPDDLLPLVSAARTGGTRPEPVPLG